MGDLGRCCSGEWSPRCGPVLFLPQVFLWPPVSVWEDSGCAHSDLEHALSTLQEVPTTASAYVESALKPFHQLQSGHKDKLRPSLVQQWLEGALSESTHRCALLRSPRRGPQGTLRLHVDHCTCLPRARQPHPSPSSLSWGPPSST